MRTRNRFDDRASPYYGTFSARMRRMHGLTRIEVVVLVLAIVLLLLFGPLTGKLANGRGGNRIQCVSNQKQISLAYLTWQNDHELPGSLWSVDPARGGTRTEPGKRSSSVWMEFAALSNELQNPKILLCPSDKERKDNAAERFDGSYRGSLGHPKYRNNSVSYFINLDAMISFSTNSQDLFFDSIPNRILIGDRHLSAQGTSASCTSDITNGVAIAIPHGDHPLATTAWTNAIHGEHLGNVAMLDGSAQHTTTTVLRELLPYSNDNGSVHLLTP